MVDRELDWRHGRADDAAPAGTKNAIDYTSASPPVSMQRLRALQ
jgi:hypothetical protein